MRISKHNTPIIMGGLMGLMMMWMLHGALTGEGTIGAGALIAFIAAHVVLAAIAIGMAVFAARLSPRVRQFMDRLHHPSLSHVAAMFSSAAAVALVLHFGIHGLGGI
ncbi:hypothetical protein [Octadecabacter ascidiaceicola]|uniref:Uncharacterized protein n=1 Tax=Octadecabacter ascidiaceicola TaxID=1655543 RepID=A0A238K7Y8_9RHOB|nr:hypothetical protein [Octadecabacter ascidiaceicola]SMX39031.1 hypothetical protein OCA8868_01799 [Octadecabacter ascidiaceicola]